MSHKGLCQLNLKGKKTYNYDVVRPNFIGRFVDGYTIPREVYEAKKRADLSKYEDEKPKRVTEFEIRAVMFTNMYNNLQTISIKKLAESACVSERTGNSYLQRGRSMKEGGVKHEGGEGHTIINPINKESDNLDGGEGQINEDYNIGAEISRTKGHHIISE